MKLVIVTTKMILKCGDEQIRMGGTSRFSWQDIKTFGATQDRFYGMCGLQFNINDVDIVSVSEFFYIALIQTN
jgi:hypothetical protein